ncbi:hypothetical protein BASA81_008353 [Batrachochytrium salamandrivorans]|nr:hypothetical protein BASA81_008353 [Batrachochytrium salamandrivorans]
MDKTYYSGEEHVFYTNSSTSDNKVYIRPKRGQELIFEGTVTGNSTPPAEPNRAVQFNDDGVFGGDGEFKYNRDDSILTVNNVLVNDSLVAGTVVGAESVSDGTFTTSAGVITGANITNTSNNVCCRSVFDLGGNRIQIDGSDPSPGDVLVYKGPVGAEWEVQNVDGSVIQEVTINSSTLNNPTINNATFSPALSLQLNPIKEVYWEENAASAGVNSLSKKRTFPVPVDILEFPNAGTSVGISSSATDAMIVAGCPFYDIDDGFPYRRGGIIIYQQSDTNFIKYPYYEAPLSGKPFINYTTPVTTVSAMTCNSTHLFVNSAEGIVIYRVSGTTMIRDTIATTEATTGNVLACNENHLIIGGPTYASGAGRLYKYDITSITSIAKTNEVVLDETTGLDMQIQSYYGNVKVKAVGVNVDCEEGTFNILGDLNVNGGPYVESKFILGGWTETANSVIVPHVNWQMCQPLQRGKFNVPPSPSLVDLGLTNLAKGGRSST